jgi:hypothetical protein
MASDKGVKLSDVEISKKYRIEFKHYSKKNSKNNREPITATVTNSAVNFNNAKNDIFFKLEDVKNDRGEEQPNEGISNAHNIIEKITEVSGTGRGKTKTSRKRKSKTKSKKSKRKTRRKTRRKH